MDRHCPDYYLESTESALKDTEDFIAYTQRRARETAFPHLVQPVVTPRFVPTCSHELLSGLGKLAEKYDCMIQSHLSESIDEAWKKYLENPLKIHEDLSQIDGNPLNIVSKSIEHPLKLA